MASIARDTFNDVGGEHAGPGGADIQNDDQIVLLLGHRAHWPSGACERDVGEDFL